MLWLRSQRESHEGNDMITQERVAADTIGWARGYVKYYGHMDAHMVWVKACYNLHGMTRKEFYAAVMESGEIVIQGYNLVAV